MIKKYSYRVLFLIAIVLIIIGIPFMGSVSEKNLNLAVQSNSNENGIIKNSNKINILEIQPGDSFTLIPEKLSGVYKYNDSIVVHHMSMPEFIGSISELNGMYDVIIIGNKTSTNNEYSQINYGGSESNSAWGTQNKSYNENDITKRKADEIIKFINTGQLVYINDSIVKDTSSIKQSNLYTKFKNISKDNFIKYNGESLITIDSIQKKYEDNVNKRFKISTDITGGDSRSNTEANGKIENRNLTFKVSPALGENIVAVTINLFLDLNGDGLFKEKEIYKSIDIENFNNTIDLQYQMDYAFIGEVPWKIEVVKKGNNSNEIKSYDKGSLYFKSISKDKKTIRVLQILPKETNLDLSEAKFKNIIDKQNDYNIVITTKSYKKYKEEVNNKTLSLNGTYDMVILGFQDEYGVWDKGADFDYAGMKELKDFIASGQSVMFTHDSIPGYDGNDKKNLAAEFRTYVGQTRFLPKGQATSDVVSNPNEYKYVEDLYKEYNVVTGQYETRYIPTLENNNKDLKGYSFWSTKVNNDKRQKVIYETNEGLITNYPFDITNSDKKFMKVALTHHQYFQLNLEDEDVVPWYNLTDYKDINDYGSDGSRVNKYDSRNFYYTYSKGNITYSGTGHTNGYTEDELKLFVNTMVKAERGANHAPTLDSNVVIKDKTDYDYDLEIDSKTNYTFTVIPKDIDNDNVKVSYMAYIMDGSNKKIISPNKSFEFQKQGTTRDVTIESDGWSNKTDKIVYVEVQVEDVRGAKSTQTYRFKPTIEPTISVVAEGKGLVREWIDVPLKITKNDENANNKILEDYEFTVDDYNKSVFEEVKITNINNNPILKVKTKAEGNETISININYGLKNSGVRRNLPVKIPISTKNPNIEVKIIDKNQEFGKYIPNIDLLSSGVKQDTKSANLILWNNAERDLLVTSGSYNVNINNIDANFKITSKIKRSDSEEFRDYDLNNTFDISYDNPKAYIEINIEKKVKDISHGLYNKVLNDTLLLNEGSVKLVRNSTATIGIGFRVVSNNVELSFEIDNALEDKEVLGLYKLDGSSIKKIEGNNLFNINGNRYIVTLPAGITSKTKLLILYKCRIPSIEENNKNEFINKIYVNGEEVKDKKFIINTTEDNKEIPLPDLF